MPNRPSYEVISRCACFGGWCTVRATWAWPVPSAPVLGMVSARMSRTTPTPFGKLLSDVQPSGNAVPSSQIAPVRSALVRSAPVRSTPMRLAFLRSALLRSAPMSFALVWFAAVRFAPVRFALLRSALMSNAYVRSAPARSVPGGWRR